MALRLLLSLALFLSILSFEKKIYADAGLDQEIQGLGQEIQRPEIISAIKEAVKEEQKSSTDKRTPASENLPSSEKPNSDQK